MVGHGWSARVGNKTSVLRKGLVCRINYRIIETSLNDACLEIVQFYRLRHSVKGYKGPLMASDESFHVLAYNQLFVGVSAMGKRHLEKPDIPVFPVNQNFARTLRKVNLRFTSGQCWKTLEKPLMAFLEFTNVSLDAIVTSAEVVLLNQILINTLGG